MSDAIDPDQFVITRKRKKYRFARFANADNCYEHDQWQPRNVDVVEVGAGTGLFSVELATRYPDRLYAAIDVKADRLQKGAYHASDHAVSNVVFIRSRVDQLTTLLHRHTVRDLWVTFPDPFPRKGAAGRRLMHPAYLERYAQVLRTDGRLFLKHDNLEFFCWSLEQLVTSGWKLEQLSFDLHASDLNEEYKVMTTYEHRWCHEGAVIKFAEARYTGYV